MSRRIAGGLLVNQDTLACDLIKEQGPQGNYLTAEHTLLWLRGQEYLWPRVSVRGPLAAWQAQGGQDTTALARDKARELGEPDASPLGSRRARILADIIARFSR